MDSTGRGKRVVVIGGGITGLTAAYRLTQAARAHEGPLEVILLEASGRLGGAIATHAQDGLLMEQVTSPVPLTITRLPRRLWG